MRIVVLDKEHAFLNNLKEHCRKAGLECLTYVQTSACLLELKKNQSFVDLILVSRELEAEDGGLHFIQNLHQDQKLAEIPYILLSSLWSKTQFAQHQKTPFGANAYFNKKDPLPQLEHLIETVLGFPFFKETEPKKEATQAILGNATAGKSISNTSQITLITLTAARDVLSPKIETMHTISLETPISLFEEQKATAPPLLAKRPAMDTPPQLPMEKSNATSPKVELSSGSIPISLSHDHIEIETKHEHEIEPHFEAESEKLKVEEKREPPILEQNQIPELAQTQQPERAEPEMPPPVSEEEAAADLPYLFSESASGGGLPPFPPAATHLSAPPLTSESTNDVEALKKYLMMKEQDNAVLTVQLDYAKQELAKAENTIKRTSLLNEDLNHQLEQLKSRLANFEHEKQHANRSLETEIEQLRIDLKSKIDRIRLLEEKLTDSAEQYEKLKDRVRMDIRKIRVREKELESKLEILKKDSETLIVARENKILELKRKIDLLEFNYDTVLDKNETEKQNVKNSEEKMMRVLKVLKLAIGVIEGEQEETNHTRSSNIDEAKAA